ncbi:unnamed protein product [Paramecium octaurelia]|uniref:Uncharacterized protein n=1 Tax=Paramecium octaurelia TaxID=43137 RepID=A0A8S1T018_PAROT|nr:unnamed protein product [Paramecium octaurelia]
MKRQFQKPRSQQNHQNIVQQNTRTTQTRINLFQGIFFFRGVVCPIEAFKIKHKQYDLIMFPAFTSTITDFAISKSYAKQDGIIFRISFNENTLEGPQFQIVRPKAIYTASQVQNEQEYLFSCFSCFIITKFNEGNIIDIEFVKI